MGDGITALKAFEGTRKGADAERLRGTANRCEREPALEEARNRTASEERLRVVERRERRETALLFILNETRFLTRRGGEIFLNLPLVSIFRRILGLILTLFPIFQLKSRRVDV